MKHAEEQPTAPANATEVEGFKIESGVPLPERHRKWPWNKMKPGDSFFSPGTDKERGYAVSSANQFAKSEAGSGWKFVSKMTEEKVGENMVKGFRIWRLS